jgi:four helix bundle protein
MTQTIPAPDPGTDAGVPAFLDCERLDCFRVAVEFQALAADIASARRLGSLRSQLDRASTSIVLNIAEGAGRRSPADKAHFYAIARGSTTERAAARQSARQSSSCWSRGCCSHLRRIAMDAACWFASCRCSLA